MNDSPRRSVLREPLLHFLLIGAALFLYFQWVGPGSGPTSSRIVLTSGQIDHLAASFAKTWQRPPSDGELKGLVDDWVREEIAVREAMAAGLDRDDSVIRRRLRQKLEFLFDDAAASATPTDPELQAWLAEHADLYRIEPQIEFRQVFVSPERRGVDARSEARALLDRLTREGPAARIDELGDPTLLPQEVDLSPRGDIVRTFGQGFADSLDSVASGSWAGPIESDYGLHLVMVSRRVEGLLPDLAAVRSQVERDYLADLRARNVDAIYERLLEKYTVVIEANRGAAAAAGAGRTGGT